LVGKCKYLRNYAKESLKELNFSSRYHSGYIALEIIGFAMVRLEKRVYGIIMIPAVRRINSIVAIEYWLLSG